MTYPQAIIQQLVFEGRDGSATYESVKRRADNWILMNSMGEAEMDLRTMGNGGEHEDSEGRDEQDSAGDIM